MIKLTVYQPSAYFATKTLSYRFKVVASLYETPPESSESSESSDSSTPGIEDPNIFLVREVVAGDLVYTEFLGVCEPYDLMNRGVTGSPRRTDTIDGWVYTKAQAQEMIQALTADIQSLLARSFGVVTTIDLSGGTI